MKRGFGDIYEETDSTWPEGKKPAKKVFGSKPSSEVLGGSQDVWHEDAQRGQKGGSWLSHKTPFGRRENWEHSGVNAWDGKRKEVIGAHQINTDSVWVGGLDDAVHKSALMEFFEYECGSVLNVDMKASGSGFHFAFVQFAQAEAVSKALALNGANFDGRKIKVSLSRRQRHQGDDDESDLTVWVGGVGPELEEHDIREYFSQWGDVINCNLKHQPDKSHNIAFVTFATQEAYKAALSVEDSRFGNSVLLVKPRKSKQPREQQKYHSQPPEQDYYSHQDVTDTVWVGCLDHEITIEDLKDFFEDHVGTVVESQIVKQPDDRFNFGFVTFEDAATAQRSLNLQDPVLGQYTLKILPSKSKHRQMKAAMDAQEETNQVFVGELDTSLPLDDIKEHFYLSCGPISEIQDFHNERGRYAFITFETIEDARKAFALSGSVLGDRAIVVNKKFRKERPEREQWERTEPRARDEPREAPPADSKSVFVGNIDPSLPSEDVRALFELHCGPMDFTDLLNERGRYGFATFRTVEAACKAFALTGTVLGDHALVVKKKYAESFAGRRHPKANIPCTTPVLWVGGLGPEWEADDVLAFFREHGYATTTAELHRRKDGFRYAFVYFADTETAQSACALNTTIWRERKLYIRPRRDLEESGQAMEDCTVVIGGISAGIAEPDIVALFQAEVGNVTSVEMHDDSCLVQFEDPMSAQAAFLFQGHELNGCVLDIRRQILDDRKFAKGQHTKDPPCNTVWAGNLDDTLGPDEIHNFFQERCGAVSSVDIMHQPEKDHTYAFVKFEHISSAEAALKLHGATLGSKTLVMSYSRRGGDMPEPGGICREYQRGTCTFGSSCRFVHEERTAVLTVPMVYVGNLTDTATEDDLQGFFEEQIGGCASVQLKKQADGSIYAFVRFHDIALAEQALNLNGVQFGPNEIRVAPKRGHQMQPEAEDVPCPRGVCKLFLKKGMCNRPSCRFQHLTSAQAALLSAADDEELLEPKIWVGNVHSDTTEAELMAFFEEHLGVGVVAKLSTHKNPDGSKRGYAFVHFNELEVAKQSLSLSGRTFSGDIIRIGSATKRGVQVDKPADPLAALCPDFCAYGACYDQKCAQWHPRLCHHYNLQSILEDRDKPPAAPGPPLPGLVPPLPPFGLPMMPFPMPLPGLMPPGAALPKLLGSEGLKGAAMRPF